MGEGNRARRQLLFAFLLKKLRGLCSQNTDELEQMEEELRTELMSLRVAQQVGGQPGKVNRIKLARKAIARVLTVQTAKRRGEAFEEVAPSPMIYECLEPEVLFE